MKIKRYVLALLKENIIYVLGFILLTVLTLTVFWLAVTRKVDDEQKINALTAEVKQLRSKSNLLNTVAIGSADFDSYLQILKSLVPDTEDFFSILYALEKLSQDTGFTITSYTINLSKSTSDKFRLGVEGVGDSNSFMNFLKEYNFGGGRLITSDKIELSSQFGGNIMIDLTFYKNKSNEQSKITPVLNNQILSELEAIKEKMHFAIKSGSDEAELDFSYPRSTSPF